MPAGMDTLEPGLLLAAMVTSVEDQSLSGYDQIVVLKASQRMVSFFQAQVLESMASISQMMTELEADPEIAHDAASAEIGAALHLTRRAADIDLALAIDLMERLPEVWEALASGKIDLRRARVIVDQTSHLLAEAARQVVDRVLEAATRLTTGQLKALIRKVCVQADPDGMVEFVKIDIPAGRFGTAEEVANVVVFLCSPAANWVTAASLNVDGGQSRSNI